MKKRSVLGIILAIVGVVLVVVALWPGAIVPSPKPGFGPYQIIALVAGAALVLIGRCMCSRCGCAGSPTCGRDQKADEQKPQPPKA